MSKHLLVRAALGVSLVTAIVAAPSTAFAANPSSGAPPTVPQVASATAGGAWLESQFNSSGYIPVAGSPDQADLSATANAVLALASVGDDALALQGLDYLSQNVDAYVVDQNNSDLPGSLALLILDAHALGANPTRFGTTDTNLVARLLATQQTSGADAGLFGTETQVADYDASGYSQGLALAALAGAGVIGTTQATAGVNWLTAEQCPDGGWTLPDNANNPCNGSPADYAGPDTNSTALAVQGLSAQGALTTEATSLAAKFIRKSQDPDGGWGYEPNAKDAPGSTDPDSTALVIQAILALGKSPTAAAYSKGSANPVATLLSYQLGPSAGSGAAGAFYYPGSTAPNLIATYEAVPAAAGVDVPFNLAVTTSSLPGAAVNSKYSAQLTASGGSAPYTWKLVSGSGTLPAGLKLNHSGVISGKPTTAGTSSFAVEVYAAPSLSAPQTEAISWKELSITTAPAT